MKAKGHKLIHKITFYFDIEIMKKVYKLTAHSSSTICLWNWIETPNKRKVLFNDLYFLKGFANSVVNGTFTAVLNTIYFSLTLIATSRFKQQFDHPYPTPYYFEMEQDNRRISCVQGFYYRIESIFVLPIVSDWTECFL